MNHRGAKVICPTCRKKGDWFAKIYGPFCSHRCKLIDLGHWFGGEQVMSEPLRPEHIEKNPDLPPGEYLDQPGLED
ncbi:MAG: DNA gyrase inhibitor YacG [Verrucomicrobiota bacterium]